MKLFLVLFMASILVISACAIEPQNAPSTQSPVIRSISQTKLAHNEIYTIQGTNFGVKTPAEPIKYDDFENGTPGQQIGNGWFVSSSNRADPMVYSTEKPNGKSTISVRQNYLSNMSYFNMIGLINQNETKYYVSFKRYSTDNLKTHNYKPFGLSHQEEYNQFEVPQFRSTVYITDDARLSMISLIGCNSSVYPATAWLSSIDIEPNKWETLEFYADMGIDTTNSSAKKWYNNKLRSSIVGSRIDCNKKWNNLLVNYYFSTIPNPGETYDYGYRAQFWLDNIYIDNTQARIIVCDVSTWAQKENIGAKCNIQIPNTFWNVTEVQFKANQGDFTDGQPVYLYVVNSDGLVNANGYPIRFGQKVIPVEDQPNVEQTP